MIGRHDQRTIGISSLSLLVVVLLLSSCHRHTEEKARSVPDTTGLAVLKKTDLFTDSSFVESWLGAQRVDSLARIATREFYYQRYYRFAWFTPEGPSERARAFLNAIQQAAASATTEDTASWSAMTVYADSLLSSWSHDSIDASRDIGMTALYFSYTHREFEGLPEEDLQRLEWFIPRKKVDWVQMLDSSIRSAGVAVPWQGPMFHQYDRLIRVLASYRSIRASGGWQLVDPVVLMARVGDADSSIAQLRKRLLQSDDLQDTSTSDLYDDALALAIKRFRLRHGLNGEAKLDSATLRLLNLPVDSGIRTILLNLERCRWVPEDPIGRHLVVNIPAFRLYAFSDSGFAWSTRVIVGKVGTATTIFTGSIRTLVLNPTWTVPRKIVYEEIIPAQRANADYLTRNKMDLFRPADLSHPVNPKKIDWKKAGPGSFPYIVRQRSGSWNALGRYKFLFPNSYDIYLHDTPSRQLFERSERTFSHGCIRVAQPERLARFVLSGDSLWTEERLAGELDLGKERFIPLLNKVPVSIVYFTSWVDEDGILQEREDIYGHDRKLADVLFKSTDFAPSDSNLVLLHESRE